MYLGRSAFRPIIMSLGVGGQVGIPLRPAVCVQGVTLRWQRPARLEGVAPPRRPTLASAGATNRRPNPRLFRLRPIDAPKLESARGRALGARARRHRASTDLSRVRGARVPLSEGRDFPKNNPHGAPAVWRGGLQVFQVSPPLGGAV